MFDKYRTVKVGDHYFAQHRPDIFSEWRTISELRNGTFTTWQFDIMYSPDYGFVDPDKATELLARFIDHQKLVDDQKNSVEVIWSGR